MVFATDGFITKVTDVGASDKLITVITAERGRIGVMVKGGRSPSSKLTSISQLFTYGNFEIYEKNSMFWLRGGSVTNHFYSLSTDIVKVALATYLCDVANELSDEGFECDEILPLLLNSIYLVSKGEKDIRIIKAVFELRAMAISGYLPELSCCAYCYEEYRELMYLDIMGGKLICTDCMAKRGAKVPRISKEFDDMPETSIICGLSPSAVAAMRYIVYSPSNKIFSFEIKDSGELDDLVRAVETYTLNHLGRGFDSLDFYKKVK